VIALTTHQMQQLCPKLGFLEQGLYRLSLNDALAEFEIGRRPERVAAFLGQALHETEGFTRLQEGFRYTPERLLEVFPAYVRDIHDARLLVHRGQEAIADRVYGGRMGNGPEGSGDGWRYRARGVNGLTGRANYRAAGKALRLPLEKVPENVSEHEVMFRVAGHYWRERGLSEIADGHSLSAFSRITRVLNGGTNGLDDRINRWKTSCKVLGLPAPKED
jgi:putative chitinase